MSAYTIHESSYYSAHLMSCGLIIESKRKPEGVNLPHNHPQFAEYVDALRTAIDDSEADALCRALLN